MMGTAPPVAGYRRPNPLARQPEKDKRSSAMRPVRPFNFNTSAELFPAAIRKKKRAGFAYRRFGTAAEAVRFAIEELPADSLNGAYLQVEEARFHHVDPQEEAGGLCLSAIWHRGRSGPLRNRGTAGGFAEWRLSAGRGSPLRPE